MASFNRFASLLIDSDSEKHTSPNGKQQNDQLPENVNAKKKRNKKKKSQSQKNDNCTGNGTSTHEGKDAAWVNHDEHLVSELFHNDLKQALELSKLEYEKQHTTATHNQTNNYLAKGDAEPAKSNIKKKNKTISLEAFLHENGDTPQQDNQTNTRGMPHKRTVGDSFFDDVEKEATAIKKQEDDIQKFKNNYNKGKEKPSKMTYKELSDTLRWKEKHIDSLEQCVLMWKTKHEKLKKKFDHVCEIVQKGEMKENCKLVVEAEKLSKIRNELMDEVTSLNMNLEQEKSKNSKLKDEILRLQGKKERTTSS